MNIEDAIIKSVTVLNKEAALKELYLVIKVDFDKWVGVVRPIPFQNVTFFQQFSTHNIPIKPLSKASISVWDYDNVTKITKILLPTKNLLPFNTFKITSPNLQIQISCQSQSFNYQNKSNLPTPQKTHRFSLPFLKKHISKRNSFKLSHQLSNQSSAVLYPSLQPSQNSLAYIEEGSLQDTSLQKIITNGHGLNDCDSNLPVGNISTGIIKSFQNKSSIKPTDSTNFFDDYEARPKQRTKGILIEEKNAKQTKQKHVKQNISTNSSSNVKNDLKNVISVLTKTPSKIGNSFKSNLHLQARLNSSRHFYDYGLEQEQKRSQNIRKKNKNNQPGNKQQNLQLFYQKFLTKKQISQVSKMTSLQLSKSIFEQYGLDLSSTKLYCSKSFETTQLLSLQKIQGKKTKNSAERRKGGKMQREKVKIETKNSENRLQTDVDNRLLNKVQSSKSLRLMERPK